MVFYHPIQIYVSNSLIVRGKKPKNDAKGFGFFLKNVTIDFGWYSQWWKSWKVFVYDSIIMMQSFLSIRLLLNNY